MRSFHVVDRTRMTAKCTKKKRTSHVQDVQNYCFSLSNMQICHVLVAVAFMLAHKWPNVYGLATTAKFTRIMMLILQFTLKCGKATIQFG